MNIAHQFQQIGFFILGWILDFFRIDTPVKLLFAAKIYSICYQL